MTTTTKARSTNLLLGHEDTIRPGRTITINMSWPYFYCGCPMVEQDRPNRMPRTSEPGLCRTCHWRRVFETHDAQLQAVGEIEEVKMMVDMTWELAWQQLDIELAATEAEDMEVSQQDLQFRLLLIQRNEALLAQCQRNEFATRYFFLATDAHFKARWGAMLPEDFELFGRWAEVRDLALLRTRFP